MPEALAHERILVTGANGFIGRHLLRVLTASGCRPVALTRTPEVLRTEFGETAEVLGIDWDDEAALRRTIEAADPTLVFHLAGQRASDGEENAADRNWSGNVGLAERLLRALASREIRRLVTVGTAEENGASTGRLSEAQRDDPLTSYGRAKAAVTRMLLERHRTDKFPAVVLRPFTVYGPEQPSRMFIAQAIHQAVFGEPFAMTEGRQKRDLVYVSDVVRGLIAAASAADVDGAVINLGSGKALPLREVAATIWRLTGSLAPLQIGARPAPPDELHDTWADISRAKELLDWEPQIDLEEGLSKTISWERERSGIANDRLGARHTT